MVSSERDQARKLNIGWVVEVTALVGVVAAAIVTIRANSLGMQFGFDFRGIWRAGQLIAAGINPYPAADPASLYAAGHPFVVPPLLGLAAVPLASLGPATATLVWDSVSVGALGAALWLVGVRDRRVYLLGLCSLPMVSAILLGQPDAVFALLAAIAWRRRGSWLGAMAVAALIAVKLLAWPLLLWLLMSRRPRQALAAAVGAGALLLGSWWLIGFHGLPDYMRLLSADAQAFAARSHSIVALVTRLGGSTSLGAVIAVVAAVLLSAAAVKRARDRDLAGFTAALLAGILMSPILWDHYIVVLFVPLAVRQPRLSRSWLLLSLLWLSPSEPPATVAQVVLVLGLLVFVALSEAGGRATSSTVPAAAGERRGQSHREAGTARWPVPTVGPVRL